MAFREDRAVAQVDDQPDGIYLRTMEQLAGSGEPEVTPAAGLPLRTVIVAVGVGVLGLLATIGLHPTERAAKPPPDARRSGVAALPSQAGAPTPPRIVNVTPAERKVRLRVGEERRFEIDAAGDGILYRWSVDGAAAGSEPALVYRPDRAQVGRRRVEVAIFGATGTRSRLWAVRVDGPRRPRIVGASPAGESIEAIVGVPVRFAVKTRAGSDGSLPRITWLLDGNRVGQGESLELRPDRAGTVRLRVVTGGDGETRVAREWQVVVVAPPEPPVPVVAAVQPEAPPRPERRDPVSVPPDTASARRDAVQSPPPAVGRKVPRLSRQEIERLLERYADAWRRHDVAELQRIGQVTSASQAQALIDYFRRTGEIEVEVRLLDFEEVDGGARIRFTRRDRFRDPLGRMVSKESPPLEKLVAPSADGLRFAASPR